MSDTPKEIEERFLKEMMKKSPAERLSMACRMFDTAKVLILAARTMRQSNEMSEEKNRYLFARLYGQDFTRDQVEEILKSLDLGS